MFQHPGVELVWSHTLIGGSDSLERSEHLLMLCSVRLDRQFFTWMIVVEIPFISSTSSSQATLINVTEHEIARQPYKPNNSAKHRQNFFGQLFYNTTDIKAPMTPGQDKGDVKVIDLAR